MEDAMELMEFRKIFGAICAAASFLFVTMTLCDGIREITTAITLFAVSYSAWQGMKFGRAVQYGWPWSTLTDTRETLRRIAFGAILAGLATLAKTENAWQACVIGASTIAVCAAALTGGWWYGKYEAAILTYTSDVSARVQK